VRVNGLCFWLKHLKAFWASTLVRHRLQLTTTLSDAKPEYPTGTKLRIVFSKSLLTTEINLLLDKIHGQLVEGTSSVGAYTARLSTGKDSQDLTAAVALLRKQQNVLLVEPVIEP
jgi:hypothetical protein